MLASRSAENLHHEIVLDLQALVAGLRRQQVAAIRQNLANDRCSAVLDSSVSKKWHVGVMQSGLTYKDTNLLLSNASRDHILEVSLQDIVKVRSSKMTRLFQAGEC